MIYLTKINYRMNEHERIESEGKLPMLKPGDLILIKTPSILYEGLRKIGN